MHLDWVSKSMNRAFTQFVNCRPFPQLLPLAIRFLQHKDIFFDELVFYLQVHNGKWARFSADFDLF